jgi:hypothetical protein
MQKIDQRIEFVANLLLIVVGAWALVLLIANLSHTTKRGTPIKSESTRSIEPSRSHTQLNHTQLNIGSLDVDWRKAPKSLLLAISTKCHFCSESSGFYRRLASAAGDDIQIVAVFPQSVSEGKVYLEGLAVPITEVRQADLSQLGVEGTPTLILTDNRGAVIDSWFGKLNKDDENAVLSHLK